MKRAFLILMSLGLLLSQAACSEVPVNSGGMVGEEPIGNDWHVWGIYEFAQVGYLEIAIGKENNEDAQHVGYNIYLDGESRGPLIGEIRCWDGDCLPDDMDMEAALLFNDYNEDGLEDIGAPLRSGDILWYIQEQKEAGDVTFIFLEVEEASAETRKDWHDWGIYRFEAFEDGMTIAISAAGNSGYEVGFNIYADLGPERGAQLGSIRWKDGGYERGFFDLDACLLLEDHNEDGLGDLGVKSRQGDILWYLQDESRRFSYAESEISPAAGELSFLAGTWRLDDPEYDHYRYEIDPMGRRYEFNIDDFVSAGLILPAGEEEGYPKYDMIGNSGEEHDSFYLLSEEEICFGDFDHPDPSMVQIYKRTN